MLSIAHRHFRRYVLGLMLLLAASANCLCVSYDTDGDDGVPPSTVEFRFVARNEKAAEDQVGKSAEVASSPWSIQLPVLLIAGHDRQGSVVRPNAGPQPLIVPLRR
ncbi:MAG TPA: hypothetical protein VLT16_06605 [Candidatus Limnocylindrales bacterium]|nr:hypothetical protein [Candidatus Limnocylindrales bacterium]